MSIIPNKTINISDINNKPKAYIIGCGIGDPELLTIRAYKAIQNLDVALIDALISDEILKLIPRDCMIIDVGKRKGFHKKNQDEINRIFYSHLIENKNVGRLKSGDPYLFGRGSEEALFLLNKGIKNIDVIPGITSAINGCTVAGIPITHRDVARSFSVVTAHLKNNEVTLDWIDLLKRKQHTTVVLMGISCISDIKKAAENISCDMNLPCAIISNASRVDQKVYISNLKTIDTIDMKEKKPAIIVFGDVVNLNEQLPNFITSMVSLF